jgi:hypothetical protein
MAAPSTTQNQTAIASASLAASGTTTGNVNLLTKFEGHFQVLATFGTVAATNGLQVDVFRDIADSTGTVLDSIALLSFVIPGTTSTTKRQSFVLGTGYYQIKLTNLDGTNAVNPISVLYETVDAVA